jgi:hypothetical protein
LESLQPFNVSVRLSVTTERLSKLRKITGKKQARFPLRPQWPPVTGSKKFTVVGGAFFVTCDPPNPRRVTVKKTVSYDRKKRGVGLGGSGESTRVSRSGGPTRVCLQQYHHGVVTTQVSGVLKQNRHAVQRRGVGAESAESVQTDSAEVESRASFYRMSGCDDHRAAAFLTATVKSLGT